MINFCHEQNYPLPGPGPATAPELPETPGPGIPGAGRLPDPDPQTPVPDRSPDAPGRGPATGHLSPGGPPLPDPPHLPRPGRPPGAPALFRHQPLHSGPQGVLRGPPHRGRVPPAAPGT